MASADPTEAVLSEASDAPSMAREFREASRYAWFLVIPHPP
jgi:hypothetical protein